MLLVKVDWIQEDMETLSRCHALADAFAVTQFLIVILNLVTLLVVTLVKCVKKTGGQETRVPDGIA